jgi:large subunit ribosomal protein L30
MKLRVRQVRSIIDRPKRQKLTIEALGLGRPNWVKIHNDTPQIRGMINRVIHLVEVSEFEPSAGDQTKPVVKKTKSTSAKSVTKKTTVKKTVKKTVSKTKKEPKSK